MTPAVRSTSAAITATLTTVVLAGCVAGASPAGGTADASPPGGQADRPSGPPRATLAPSPSPGLGEVPPANVSAARALLAARVGAGAAENAPVVVAEAVTWPDGSLGCPEPGMFYTQMVVPGYHIVFEVDGQRYDYRMGRLGDPRLCESGRPLGS